MLPISKLISQIDWAEQFGVVHGLDTDFDLWKNPAAEAVL